MLDGLKGWKAIKKMQMPDTQTYEEFLAQFREQYAVLIRAIEGGAFREEAEEYKRAPGNTKREAVAFQAMISAMEALLGSLLPATHGPSGGETPFGSVLMDYVWDCYELVLIETESL